MDEREIIARNIAYYRKKHNLSQLELAEKLQYSNKNISKWEKGETTPNIFTLKRLAQVFDITVDQLISEALPEEKAESEDSNDLPKVKIKSTLIYKLLYLLMANAILLVCASIAVYILSLFQVKTFNKWLLFIYILPLSALSVFIFITCLKKRAEIFSLSAFIWFMGLSIYLSFKNQEGNGFVFLMTFGFQVLIIFIVLLINVYLNIRAKRKLNNEQSKKE